MTAPDRIKELTETFADNLDAYKKGSYNETQVRREFIDPLFELLGWDITNKSSAPAADLVHAGAAADRSNTFTNWAPCKRSSGPGKLIKEPKTSMPAFKIIDHMIP